MSSTPKLDDSNINLQDARNKTRPSTEVGRTRNRNNKG